MAGLARRNRRRRPLVALGLTGAALATSLAVAAPPAGAEASADLSVALSHAPDNLRTGDATTVTVTVRNDGPDTAVDAYVGVGYSYPLGPISETPLPEGCRYTSSEASLLCSLGDLASGAEVSRSFPFRAYGSGLFTQTAAVSSDTPDPDGNDRVATNTVLVKPGDPQGVRWVKGTFPRILGRPADAGSISYWGARWKAQLAKYPRDFTSIPAGIIGSNEHRRNRISGLYQDVLGRAPDAGGLSAWIARSKAGWSYEAIARQLMSSNEFANRFATPNARTTAIFDLVVERAPTSAELAAWSPPGSTSSRIAALQRTTEAYDVIIRRAFEVSLDRAPGSLDRYIWQVRLRNGYTPERLWAMLLVGNEYMQDYPMTDDDYVDLPFYDSRAGLADLQAELDAA